MRPVFHIKKFSEIRHLLPQDSWWIQRLKHDKDRCENEIIAFAEGDVSLDNLYLDFVYLNIGLNDETVRDRVAMVLVQGNVSAKNILNEETDGAVSLIVLGNLEADNITAGGQEIYVSGNLTVHDLFWGDYNHGELIVKGSVAAKVFMASDYHFDGKRFYNKENVSIGLLLNDDDVNGDYPRELMETAFQEECLLREEDIHEEIYSFKDWLDPAEISRRLNENIPVLLDAIKALPEDDIPFAFENDYLTDNNMERFRTSFLFSLFGGPETNIKRMEFRKNGIFARVSVQPGKPFSANIYLQHEEEYAVMIFYFTYEGNLRRGIVHKSLAGEDKEWHSLDERSPQHVKALAETGWKNLLYEFSAMEHYRQRFREQVTVESINGILSLPLVKDEYSDYYDDEGESFYAGNLMCDFRQKENEKKRCPRISIIKNVPYAGEADKFVFYHLDILQDEQGNDTVKLRTQDNDGYDSEVYIVPVTNTEKYKEAVECFSLLQKKIFKKNEEYIHRPMQTKETWIDINNGKMETIEIKNHGKPVPDAELPASLPVDGRYQYLVPLWKGWVDAIEQIVPKENEYFNLANGISQNDIGSYTTIDNGINIAEELVNFYKIQNVTYNPVTSAFSFSVNGWNYDLLPFRSIPAEWEAIMDLQGDGEPQKDIVSEKLKLDDYANPNWIPFATGRNGDYLLYDTDPSDKGKYGQIVELQNESWQRNVVADSLQELIRREIDAIKSGYIKKFDFISGRDSRQKQ